MAKVTGLFSFKESDTRETSCSLLVGLPSSLGIDGNASDSVSMWASSSEIVLLIETENGYITQIVLSCFQITIFYNIIFNGSNFYLYVY